MPNPTPKAIASASSSPVAAGAFVNPINGQVVANGYILLRLNLTPSDGIATLSGGGEVLGTSIVKITLDANGVPSAGQTIYGSDQYSSPVNPTYNATIYDTNGNQLGSSQNWLLTGAAPLDITTVTSTASGASYNQAVVTTPSAQQTINGQNLVLEGANLGMSAASSTTGDSWLSRIAANVFGIGKTSGASDAELRLAKLNKITVTQPATGSTLTIADGKTLTANSSTTIAGTDGKTLTVNNSLTLAGTDGKTATFNNSLTFAGTDATTQTFQASDTIVGRGTTDTLTNKTLTSPVMTGPTVNTGVSQGSGLKHQRFGSLCTTGAAAGNACTTAVTWTSAFADANYTVSCIGVTASNVPTLSIESIGASGFTVRITTVFASAATFASVNCIALHD